MKYSYKCENCEKKTIIEKPMSESGRVEFCEICENELKRVYEPTTVVTADGIKF
jgi:predicted nucleic acid-binding Zn ribbon protein